MYGLNPFDAWNMGNGQSNENNPWSGSQSPSVYGALPWPGSPPASGGSLGDIVTFKFTYFNPTILNCKVVGPHDETGFEINTEISSPAYTVFKDGTGTVFALIDWSGSRPHVEALGSIPKQPVASWMRLTPDRGSRIMIVDGASYSWTPSGRFLHLTLTNSSTLLARIYKTHDSVYLEITPSGIQLGLLNVAVLGTTLLQCGKSID